MRKVEIVQKQELQEAAPRWFVHITQSGHTAVAPAAGEKHARTLAEGAERAPSDFSPSEAKHFAMGFSYPCVAP